MGKPARHVLVCVNRRPDGGKGSCAARGSEAVLSALRTAVALEPSIAVTETGCLGPCLDGPTLVVYPEAVWYAGVTVDDVREIVQSHLQAGQVVERLRYRWPDE